MPLQIVRNDITRMKTDIIVNTANPHPAVGTGTDSAIYDAAGREALLAERVKIGEMKPGEAAVTSGFALPAKYIIHTVGPRWTGDPEKDEPALAACYENSLALARDLRAESISFPLISAGHYGFPADVAFDVAVRVIRSFLSLNEMLVYLVVFSTDALRVSQKLFPDIEQFIDDRFAETRLKRSMRWPRRSRAPLEAHIPLQGAPSAESLDEAAKPFVPPRPRYGFRPGSSLERALAGREETFQQALLRLIRERGMTNAEVYKRANLTKQHFAKINADPDYQPKKETAIALCLALYLDLPQTQRLLARAGYTLTHASQFDMVIEYLILHEVYDVILTDQVLFEHGLPTLSR